VNVGSRCPRLIPLLYAIGIGVGVLGCRAVEEPEPHGKPLRGDPSPLQISTEPTDGEIRLPDFARVAREVGPSVVGVISTVESGTGRLKGIGSGMIVSVHGEVLTNEHVVRHATKLEVLLADHTQVAAEVVFADPLLDLALLQLRGEFSELAPVVFRDRNPAPGEWIMAIGQPFGLGDTVTVGVVSGLGRDYGDVGRPPDLDPNGIWSFIQTDASINIGNSGGPLVDVEGKVVGITTAVRQDGQGLAFAVPSAMAIEFVDEVRTYRRMRHTRLGILARDDTEVEGRATAVRVTRVDPDGPGDRAELQVDDLVLEIDDTHVGRVSDVAYLTQLAGVGSEVTLTIARGPEMRTFKVVIIPEMAS
jgi:S1-C subfamily serine protease